MAETEQRIILLKPEQVDRFWAKVQQGDPWECWPWLGAINDDGYGVWSVRISRTKTLTFYTHRLAYALARGPIPAPLEAAHALSCITRACSNPDHLTPKSHWDNLQDIPLTRLAKGLQIGLQL